MVELIGHRGARGLFPENTLEGFARTLALGIDGIELDVGLTRDGVPVVCHDPALNPDLVRGQDGTWLRGAIPLRDLTWAQLQHYDVGRARPGGLVALRFPQQARWDGIRIPRLEDALRAIPCPVIVEMKTLADRSEATAPPEQIAEAVLAAVDAADAAARVIIESFDWRGPRHIRRLRPEIKLAWLTRPETARNARLWWDGSHPDDYGGSVSRAVAAEGGGAWAPEHGNLTTAAVVEAQGLGLLVLPWTVNTPARMLELAGWGIDGFITDRPDIGRNMLMRRPQPES
ncbi:MAG: glycerophosphodiester phosphodiesterase [Acetobacteraceae bacterium]|nr:glycerophosphodiester phosphodiesterase [Acetobacteraceae bacterium]